jgi:hypothetical protein
MGFALRFPETAQGKRNGSTSLLNKEVSATNVSFARTVLAWAPDLKGAVLSGAETLTR